MHGRQCPGALRCYYSVPRLLIRNARFLPRDAMLARYLLCQSVRPLQAGIVSKRLDESRWFLAWRLPPAYPTPCCKEIWMSPEICVLPPRNFLPNSGLKTVSPRQVDRVINKTRRRRRRSSLLTTPIRQSTSRGCLLQVGQLQPSDFITLICCGFVDWLTARRAVRLRRHSYLLVSC